MATIGGSNIVRSGLVLHLDAANPKSYVNGSTSWFDLSGNGNTGTLTNGPTFNSGNGGSIVFDGVNDYCKISLPNTITIQTLTYDCWINHTGATGFRTIIDQNNDKWLFCLENGTLGTYNPIVSTGIKIPNNTWVNVSLSHVIGQPLYFFVNGNLVYTSQNNSTVQTISSIGIGAGITGESAADEFWSGRISSVKFYNNQALSAVDIRQNYNATRSRFNL